MMVNWVLIRPVAFVETNPIIICPRSCSQSVISASPLIGKIGGGPATSPLQVVQDLPRVLVKVVQELFVRFSHRSSDLFFYRTCQWMFD